MANTTWTQTGGMTGPNETSDNIQDFLDQASASAAAAADSAAEIEAQSLKLAGIEAGADVTDTANVTAAGALMDSELTNIAAVKSLNQGVATTNSPSFAGLTTATLDVNTDALVHGVTVGRGGGFIDTNTTFGRNALRDNTTGDLSTAFGRGALRDNTTGSSNNAFGRNALLSNTTSSNSSAFGRDALRDNTTGSNNTAFGGNALRDNTTGSDNTASGVNALLSNTGSDNTAFGRGALRNNTTGIFNTASGRSALLNNTTGSGNLGLAFISNSGSYAPVFDPTTEDNRIVMGHTAVTNAYVQVAWTVVSDQRDKADISPVTQGLDFVKNLSPVAYRYKPNRNAEEGHGPLRYGFLAQDILALEGQSPVIVDNENPEKLKMNDQSLIAVLVKAIQELQAEVEKLKG